MITTKSRKNEKALRKGKFLEILETDTNKQARMKEKYIKRVA